MLRFVSYTSLEIPSPMTCAPLSEINAYLY